MKTHLRGAAHALVLLLYALLTVIMTWPLARHVTSAIPGDSFDGWQNYWNLWWIKRALVDQLQNPLVTDLLYAPTGVSLYFHTLNPFNGLSTLPIQLSTNLLVAYNAVVLISWVLGGYGMFLLSYWLLRPKANDSRHLAEYKMGAAWKSYAPPFLAGLIYTFSPFHMAHLLGHMQVMSLQWLPFYLLLLLRALDRRRSNSTWLREAVLAGLFLALVGLCDWYFVLYLFFFTGLFIVWHWAGETARNGRHAKLSRLPAIALRSLARWVTPPLLAALLFLLLLSPMLIPMVREAMRFDFMVRPPTDLYMLSASLSDFLIPNRLHTLFRPQSFTWLGNQVAPVSERTIAIGYLPLLLALAGAVLDRKRSGFWLLSLLFFLLLALGPVIHLGNITTEDIPHLAAGEAPRTLTLFSLLNASIPFMSISRSVSRYALMVQLAVAVLAAIGLKGILNRILTQDNGAAAQPDRLSRAPVLIVIFCCALLLFEYWVAPYPMSPPDTPPFYAELQHLPGDGSVLNLPMNYDRPGYLLYQTVHQKPLTVAYISRDDPRTLTERAPVLQQLRHLGPDIVAVDPVEVGLTLFEVLNIDYVVLDRYKMPGGPEREYTEALARAIFGNRAPLFEDERLTVYQTPDAAEARPYLVLGPLNWGPLQSDASGRHFRTLREGEARLGVYHSTDEMALRIRYRTTADAALQYVDGSGANHVEPPQPNGAEVVLPLAHYGVAQPDGSLEITLQGSGTIGGVEIEEVALVSK